MSSENFDFEDDSRAGSISHSDNQFLRDNTFKKNLYNAIYSGNQLEMQNLLSCLSCTVSKKYILENPCTIETEAGTETASALIIASKYGHISIVCHLVKKIHVDINQNGTVRFDGYLIEGASALWCAAGAGHIDIVKFLVNNNADINRTTASNSTPLRAACFDGRIDIVKYLYEKGADLTIPNKFRNNCLMISTYRGHLAVVEFLLSCNMDPNYTAQSGATALQFAAEAGHALIAKRLVEAGADLRRNAHDLDPLFIASENAQEEVVLYFVNEPRLNIARERKIDAIELLGAALLNDKDHYAPLQAWQHLYNAMVERLLDPPIVKTPLAPVAAYKYYTECCSTQELDAIQFDFERLQLEGLMIRERILGVGYIDIAAPIIYRGAVCADNFNFQLCVALWLRALELRFGQQRPSSKDLLRLAQVHSQMLCLEQVIEPQAALRVLELAVLELERQALRQEKAARDGAASEEQRKQLSNSWHLDMHTVLYLLYIMDVIEERGAAPQSSFPGFNDAQLHDLRRHTYNLLKRGYTLDTGATLLHMACDPNTYTDSFHIDEVVHFPACRLAIQLLRCGASPDAVDAQGRGALHLCTAWPVTDMAKMQERDSLVSYLLKMGAHHDRVDSKGARPGFACPSGAALLRRVANDTLQCCAARRLKELGLVEYLLSEPTMILPVELKAFLRLH